MKYEKHSEEKKSYKLSIAILATAKFVLFVRCPLTAIFKKTKRERYFKKEKQPACYNRTRV